ncbi:16S rRNA (guanine(527)-N(7))-methyltransferase RsmG [Sphaerochaeta sp. PS]|uniref:16S rRNA (guanine(527)-N(7))-methyltransferase RsmG n=1 Tax=Sphaerochaeta sp. PS TaxID=3076336 RepID=UPI0028A3FEAA|nr:16S rRNA (guanine(527)-N(7))-methyltransferase RsmG [Sphaerochaeta sp. PS]MDT4761918.1 16S rRNA (guanine(527)-N(7))-methyltransferase RsmG [Sphaerochaeta sp. PS]
MGKYDELLSSSLAELGLAFDADQMKQLNAYIAELELWNPAYKLVGAEGEELITKHIIDSLSAVKTIQGLLSSYTEPHIADLGSGAGLPGIPLAIALKGCHVTLVERMGRRVGFLRNALAICRLTDRVEVCDKDLKEVGGTFHLITFRAFRPLYDILDAVEPILAEDGVVVAYKGQEENLRVELEKVAQTCTSRWDSSEVSLSVPHLEAQRMLCLLQKHDTFLKERC